MKRFLTVLLLAGLCAGKGCAAPALFTVQDIYDQAAGGWQEAWTAEGKDFAVDMEVSVPIAEALPVLWVTKAATETVLLSEGPYSGEEGADQEFPRNVLPLADACWDVPYAENNPMTLAQADALMAGQLAGLTGGKAEMMLWEIVLLGRLRKTDAATGKFLEPLNDMGGYVLHYRQTLKGVPVLADAAGECGIAATVFSAREIRAVFSLYEEAAAVEEDAALCSFDAVKNAVRTLVEQGVVESTGSLALGYAVYMGTGDGDAGIAVPAWLLSGSKNRQAAGKSILISARTGEIMPWPDADGKAYPFPGIRAR